jgi:hypothetical protein
VDLVPLEVIERRILVLRSTKVMLDTDLASLYDVPTGVLNQAVKRNRARFPADFMFRLNPTEAEAVADLRSQSVISNLRRGGRRYAPYAFTEQGVAMLSSVLNSDRAIVVNIGIMRAFVRLREILATDRELASRFAVIERKVTKNTHDIHMVSEIIRHMMAPRANPKKQPIGFPAPGDHGSGKPGAKSRLTPK